MKIAIRARGIDAILRQLKELKKTRRMTRRVSEAVRSYIALWYQQRPDWFDTKDSPTHGPGREDTHWTAPLEKDSAWVLRERGDSYFVELRAPDVFKAQFWGIVNGMTITPKQASALTIPIIPEAHGKSVAEYEFRYDTELFRPRGKDYLAEATGAGSIRVVYLLRQAAVIPSLLSRTGHYAFPWRTRSFEQLLTRLFHQAAKNHLSEVFVRVGNSTVRF